MRNKGGFTGYLKPTGVNGCRKTKNNLNVCIFPNHPKEVESPIHSVVQCFLEVAVKGNEHTLMHYVIPVGLGFNPVSMAIGAMMTNLLL